MNTCRNCWERIAESLIFCSVDCASTETEDIINKPNHYTNRGWIEPIDFIISNNMDFLEGSIIKYVYRYKNKWWIQSLEKARFYLDKLMTYFQLEGFRE